MTSNSQTILRDLSSPARKRAFGLVFFIMLMDIIGLSILSPIAPFIVHRYSSDALMVTLLTAIYAAAQFISAPILGKISDRVGRRPVLLVCILGSAVGYFIFGIAGALWVLFLSRLIDGITGGNLSTAAAYIIDVSKPEERAKNMTLIGMAYGMGFILGPALGGALGQISLNAPIYASGFLSLATVVLIFFMLPESLPKERRETAPLRARDFNPLASIGYMLAKPGLGLILVVYCLFNLAFDGVNSILGVFVVGKFSVLPWQIGLLFVMAGVATAIVQGALVGKLVPRYGEKRLALTSLLGTAAGGLGVLAAPVFWLLYPIVFLQSAIGGFIWSTLGTLAANRVNEREQGQLAGVNSALAGLMAMLGPLWGGAAYDHVMPGAPYWIAPIILVLASFLLVRARTSAPAAHLASADSAD
jgi:MFS transporter, DHA1 family, tetracycline resistance protein